ncbi:hypothetical protein HRbin16_01691 [bacterium HR16]|nr:hypothetical protein HRbin16_01691 [bacterium HR16]
MPVATKSTKSKSRTNGSEPTLERLGPSGGQEVLIQPPRFESAQFRIVGIAPYCQARFSQKAMQAIREQHEAGQRARKGKAREPRNFEEDYKQAMHVSTEGWVGIPASAFRNALISACRLVGFKMTLAKLSLFVAPDGFDAVDGTPLVKIEGEPEMSVMPVRNATGVLDLRARPMWRQWAANLVISWDSDQFSLTDVVNLLSRTGLQVGIGEGRPDSRESHGLGWGLFSIESATKISSPSAFALPPDIDESTG